MSTFDRILAAGLPAVPKPVVRYFSRPYIAGETEEEMLAVVRRLKDEGFASTVDLLGEFTSERAQAERATKRYESVMNRLWGTDLPCKVSVKLTQLGLKIDKGLCHENIRRLVQKASERDSFVRIDMEDSSCTTGTLDIFFRLHEEFPGSVGPVIQAYLRRSLDDVRRLATTGANIRLCKGIYVEPREIAFQDPEIVNRSFVELLEVLFDAGCYVGIATHDERLVWEAFRLIDRLSLDASRYEFQMLLGVDEPLRGLIRHEGHKLRVYVPFGRQWYEYSLRRLRENPRIAGYVARSVFSMIR